MLYLGFIPSWEPWNAWKKSATQAQAWVQAAKRKRLEYKELERAIKTDAMTAILGSRDVQSQMLQAQYPQAPLLFKDRVSLDMLGLPLIIK